jgi:hypothetical protein
MNATEWIAQAKKHQKVLLSLIESYHPASHAVSGRRQRLPITAPSAESACQAVREQISAEDREKAFPRDCFLTALQFEDWKEINNLLNAAWFGVPESTSCWGVEGFKEAVELIEDPPEPPEIEDQLQEVAF